MDFKLGVFALAVFLCFKSVNGLRCYECEDVDADLPGMQIDTGETCKYKIPKGRSTNCPESKPHCLKASGTVMNGKYVELRSCAGDEFKFLLEGKTCTPVKDVENFKFNLGTQRFDPESGDVCVCECNECNQAAQAYPIYNVIIVGTLLVLFRN